MNQTRESIHESETKLLSTRFAVQQDRVYSWIETLEAFESEFETSRTKRRKLGSNIPSKSPQNKRRRSPRKPATSFILDAAQTTSEKVENVEAEDGEDTAVDSGSLPYRPRDKQNWVLDTTQVLSEQSTTLSQTSPSAKSRGRSMSPSKKLRGLELSWNSMRWTQNMAELSPLDSNTQELVSDMYAIADKMGVIPKSITSLSAENFERIRPWNVEDGAPWLQSDLSNSGILERAIEIKKKAIRCAREHLGEASWNDDVHSRMLDLALRGHWEDTGIEYWNVTAVRIDEQQSAASGGSRMVDYCITMGGVPAFKTRIIDFLRRKGLGSINHTSDAGMVFTPIGISVKTKRDRVGGDDGRHQLGVWVAAHFANLRRLCRPHTPLPPLLLITVQGHDWKMCIATPGDGALKTGSIFWDIAMGDTVTLTGIFMVIKGLKRMAIYIAEVYLPWFEANILDIGQCNSKDTQDEAL